MRIAICDDNKTDLANINKTIRDLLRIKSIGCDTKLYTSASEFLSQNAESMFDVVFLDLDMPEMNGMEVASQLNNLNESTEIVFVTNHDELVYKVFRFKAIGFVRKKHMYEEIEEILDALIKSINTKRQNIVFPGLEKKYSINEIIFMQSDDHYVDIFTDNEKSTIREKLNDIERDYSHYGFLRIHSRYLVNYRYIYSIENNVVVLNNQKQLPLSRNKSKIVKKAFQYFSRRI